MPGTKADDKERKVTEAMMELRTENTGVRGRETLMGFDAKTGTLRIERLASGVRDLDAVLGFTCIDADGDKCRLMYEPAKGADRGEPGKYWLTYADGSREQIKKLDLTSKGCPKKSLSFRRPADLTVEIPTGMDITVRCGMKLDLHVRAADGHGLGIARGLTFDDNPDPYVSREDMKFNTRELMDKIKEITAEGYTLNLGSGKEDVNIGPFEVISGKGVHSYISFEKEDGAKRSLFIDNKMVRSLSLAAARRNEKYEMKKAEKYTALYKSLEPLCRNRRERELIQRHIFAGDDIMGIPMSELVNDPSEAAARLKIYHDSTSMVLSFAKNLSSMSTKEKKAFRRGEGSERALSEAIRKATEMTVRLGTDGYSAVLDGVKGSDVVLRDDSFEHMRGTPAESYEAQRREIIAKFSFSFADTVQKENFREVAGYCREHGYDLIESARVTENEPLLWGKVIEQDTPELFMNLLASSSSLRDGKPVPEEVAMSVFSMMKEGRFELDAPEYRKTSVLNAIRRGSMFYEIMSAPETNLTPAEAAELTEAYLAGGTELTAADIHKLASAEGVRRVDAIKDYLLTGDERLLEGNIAYRGRYVQEMMEKFIEKATGEGVKRWSQDPENAGFTAEVITDPMELINEFNNTNRMGCRVISLGDGLLNYTVPVVGGLFAESFEEVGEEFPKLRNLAEIQYSINLDVIREYRKDIQMPGYDAEYEEYNSMEEQDFDEEEYESYEVYSLG